MRKAIALTIAACLLLCGCSGNGVSREQDAPEPNVGGRFLCDKESYRFSTVVDMQTGVTYLIWTDTYNSGKTSGITALVDRDGKPIISEEVAE